MKRSSETSDLQDCRVSASCTIICVQEGENWQIFDSEKVPEHIRRQYEACRARQRLKFFNFEEENDPDYQPGDVLEEKFFAPGNETWRHHEFTNPGTSMPTSRLRPRNPCREDPKLGEYAYLKPALRSLLQIEDVK